MAVNHDIEIEQGVPFEQGFVVREDNQLKILTGYSARLHFRVHYSSSNVELEASTSNSKLAIEGSVVYIRLSDVDTSSLQYRNYYYDMELLNTLGEPVRLVEGRVLVIPKITR